MLLYYIKNYTCENHLDASTVVSQNTCEIKDSDQLTKYKFEKDNKQIIKITNVNNVHWVLYIETPDISCVYDTLPPLNSNQLPSSARSSTSINIPYYYTNLNKPCINVRVQQQDDGTSCGFYCLAMIVEFIYNNRLPHEIEFPSSKVLREWVAYCILKNKIEPCRGIKLRNKSPQYYPIYDKDGISRIATKNANDTITRLENDIKEEYRLLKFKIKKNTDKSDESISELLEGLKIDLSPEIIQSQDTKTIQERGENKFISYHDIQDPNSLFGFLQWKNIINKTKIINEQQEIKKQIEKNKDNNKIIDNWFTILGSILKLKKTKKTKKQNPKDLSKKQKDLLEAQNNLLKTKNDLLKTQNDILKKHEFPDVFNYFYYKWFITVDTKEKYDISEQYVKLLFDNDRYDKIKQIFNPANYVAVKQNNVKNDMIDIVSRFLPNNGATVDTVDTLDIKNNKYNIFKNINQEIENSTSPFLGNDTAHDEMEELKKITKENAAQKKQSRQKTGKTNTSSKEVIDIDSSDDSGDEESEPEPEPEPEPSTRRSTRNKNKK